MLRLDRGFYQGSINLVADQTISKYEHHGIFGPLVAQVEKRRIHILTQSGSQPSLIIRKQHLVTNLSKTTTHHHHILPNGKQQTA
jgi:hypothetical protein